MDIGEKLLLPTVAVLAGVVVFLFKLLWNHMQDSHKTTKQMLDECDEDRAALWKELRDCGIDRTTGRAVRTDEEDNRS